MSQFGRKCGQSVVTTVPPAKIENHVLRFNITCFFQSLPEGSTRYADSLAALLLIHPITGVAGCCARAASGHAAAATPSSVMNSRCFMDAPPQA
jgi:hypothetical protein